MEVAGANRRWRCQFRYRGSRRESAVAQLFSLGITMRRLFPEKFGLRERWLSTLAIGMAVVFAYLSLKAGFGALLVMLLFTIFGTAVFIAISGSDRLFFTTLFTFSFVTFTLAVVLYRHFFPVVGEETEIGAIVAMGLFCYGLFVAVPVAFVWIAPKILKYARRDA